MQQAWLRVWQQHIGAAARRLGEGAGALVAERQTSGRHPRPGGRRPHLSRPGAILPRAAKLAHRAPLPPRVEPVTAAPRTAAISGVLELQSL